MDKPKQNLERFDTIRVFILTSTDILGHLVLCHMVAMAASDKTVYDDSLAGHFRDAWTLKLIRRKYYWSEILKKIQTYVC